MTQRRYKFFICTRDRSEILERCILSLATSFDKAFPGIQADCYIFDDSTIRDASHQIYTMWNEQKILGLQVSVIDFRKQMAILQGLSCLSPQYHALLNSSCKKIGQGQWDLAGVRNFAFICAYAYSHEDDLLVFLDDDILFHSNTYHNYFIPISGDEVLRKFSALTPSNSMKASGVGYFGRADIPAHEHIILVIENVRAFVKQPEQVQKHPELFDTLLQEVSLFPQTLPTFLNLPDTTSLESGPGISGAALATTPASVRSHGLIRYYNEDWIWLSLLGASESAIQRIEPRLMHAAPSQLPITKDFFNYQMSGDIMYFAIEYTFSAIPAGYNRLQWCKEHICNDHFAAARQSQMQKIHAALEQVHFISNIIDGTYLDPLVSPQVVAAVGQGIRSMREYLAHALSFIESQEPACFYERFLLYLESTQSWPGLLDAVKGHLNHN